eukprot:3251259-Ditylum_brightwellii.AAC.1
MESRSDQESIPDLVQCLSLDTSDCYVAPPAKSQTMEDLLLALRCFKNSVHWKEYCWLNQANNNKTTSKDDDVSMASDS